MSKAEEFAYSKYTKSKEGVLYDLARNSIIQGYQQAEEDLGLTWEDIEQIYFLVMVEANKLNKHKHDVKEMYQEVLKRFVEMKEK